MTPRGTRRLRLDAARRAADERALLVTAPSSVRYLTGFTGSAGALWVPRDAPPTLITDSRYAEQVRAEAASHILTHVSRKGWIHGLSEVLEDGAPGGESPALFESEHLTFADREAIEKAVPTLELVPRRDLIRSRRQVKDRREVELIERAVAVAESAFTRLLAEIDWGDAPTERQVAIALEAQLRRGGSEPLPFDPIVAAGDRSALPHAAPTDRPIVTGDLLLIDFGARVEGYCSDITRCAVLGTPQPWQTHIHEQVTLAQDRAREAMHPGASAPDVDRAARDSLASRDLAVHFDHGTGHGIGLDVHEGPSLSSRSEEVLQAGNVVTVEPGVYLPGRGGVRIEDDVLVEQEGPRSLTRLPHTLVRL